MNHGKEGAFDLSLSPFGAHQAQLCHHDILKYEMIINQLLSSQYGLYLFKSSLSTYTKSNIFLAVLG